MKIVGFWAGAWFGRGLFCVVALAFVSGSLSVGAVEAPHDEVFDARGEVRPAYRLWERASGRSVLDVDPAVAAKLNTFPLGDKVKIYGVPLIIDGRDYETVVMPGTRQRALALRHFFYDLFIGPQKIFDEPAFKDKITRELVDFVVSRNVDYANVARLREYYRDKTLADINFMYGPDLLRGADGRWTVTEDNIGYLGGLVDSFWIENAFVAAHGLPGDLVEREAFFKRVVREYMEDARIPAARAVGLFDAHMISESADVPMRLTIPMVTAAAVQFEHRWLTGADNEFNRMANLLRDLSIPVEKAEDCAGDKSYLKRLTAGEIDFVFERCPPNEWVNFLQYRAHVMENPGLRVLPSFATHVLSSKIFLPHVEDLIRFYLHEEPILPTAPSAIMTKGVQMLALAKQLREAVNQERPVPAYVLKDPEGSQGSNVVVIDRLDDEKLKTLAGILAARAMLVDVIGLDERGGPLLVQERLPGSVIPVAKNSWLNLEVEVRPIAVALGENIRVRSRPWGRGNFQIGHNLNNVSQGAFEVVVFKDTDLCAQRLLAP